MPGIFIQVVTALNHLMALARLQICLDNPHTMQFPAQDVWIKMPLTKYVFRFACGKEFIGVIGDI
ncbi:hypothetical protein D3C86_1864190 [compost metagenome]